MDVTSTALIPRDLLSAVATLGMNQWGQHVKVLYKSQLESELETQHDALVETKKRGLVPLQILMSVGSVNRHAPTSRDRTPVAAWTAMISFLLMEQMVSSSLLRKPELCTGTRTAWTTAVFVSGMKG